MRMRSLVVVSMLGVACSDKGGGTAANTTPPVAGSADVATQDRCETVVDKVFGLLERKGRPADPGRRDGAARGCLERPDDPTNACVLAATDDAGVEGCLTRPKGEPVDQLAKMTERLRTYFFVNETFTDQRVGLTPATPCCQFPTKKCPPEPAPNELLAGMLQLDLSTERAFQYRFESTSKKAVIEAVGDRDCDGTLVTYRRELEQRADGNMHVTVLDPPDGSD